MNYKLINEGNTEIFVSEDNFLTKDPKSSNKIFYNKNMELNRDITISIMNTYKKILKEQKNILEEDINYIDAFTASGIRGIRAAKELGIHSILNDSKKELFEHIKNNVIYNNVDDLIQIKCNDANVILTNNKATIVDIDPFGSPSRYIHSAILSSKNLLNITATDTASLCGAHLWSGIRKYSSVPINCEFHSELGLRILLGFICRSMAIYNKSMNVLFSHVTRHYLRCYIEINNSIKKVNQTLKNIGYVIFCKKCGSIETINGYFISIDNKCKCGFSRSISGPLWLGSLIQRDFCNLVIKDSINLKLNKKKEMINLIESCISEIESPFYYNYHKICKQLKVSAIKIDEIIENLRINNYNASRTHMIGTGIKTNAPINIIKNIISNINKK